VVAVPVALDAPVQVPVEALVGWTGALTPSLGPLAESAADGELGSAAPRAVELTGEGRVLVDDGAAPRS